MWGPSQGPEPDTQTGLRRPAPVGIAEGEQPACAAAAGPPRARMGAQGGGGGGGHQAQGPSSGWRCPGSPSVSRPGARAQGSGVTLSVPVLRGGRGGSGLLAACGAHRTPAGSLQGLLVLPCSGSMLERHFSAGRPLGPRAHRQTRQVLFGAGVRPCVLPSSVVRGTVRHWGCQLQPCVWLGAGLWVSGLALWPGSTTHVALNRPRGTRTEVS